MSQVLSTTRQVWLQIISKNDIKESGLKLAGQCLKTVTQTNNSSPESIIYWKCKEYSVLLILYFDITKLQTE